MLYFYEIEILTILNIIIASAILLKMFYNKGFVRIENFNYLKHHVPQFSRKYPTIKEVLLGIFLRLSAFCYESVRCLWLVVHGY